MTSGKEGYIYIGVEAGGADKGQLLGRKACREVRVKKVDCKVAV
jgi:hypothetical protein